MMLTLNVPLRHLLVRETVKITKLLLPVSSYSNTSCLASAVRMTAYVTIFFKIEEYQKNLLKKSCPALNTRPWIKLS